MKSWLQKFLQGDPETLRNLRGWSLMMLYLSLGAWSILFAYAVYHFWPDKDAVRIESINHSGLMVLSVISAFFCIRTSVQYWTAYIETKRFPQTAFLPFLTVVATIVVAGQTLV